MGRDSKGLRESYEKQLQLKQQVEKVVMQTQNKVMVPKVQHIRKLVLKCGSTLLIKELILSGYCIIKTVHEISF